MGPALGHKRQQSRALLMTDSWLMRSPYCFLHGSGWMEVVMMRPPGCATGAILLPRLFMVKAPTCSVGTIAARTAQAKAPSVSCRSQLSRGLADKPALCALQHWGHSTDLRARRMLSFSSPGRQVILAFPPRQAEMGQDLQQ